MTTKRSPKTMRVPPAEQALQLKVTLRDIRPPIWRRVVVPDNFTLGQLHEVIQRAMGWHNSHLHAFRFGEVSYSSPAFELEEMEAENETTVFLCQVVSRAKQKFIYEYDFGDGWEHEIVVEKLLPVDPQAKGPICLDGARACPPEDCGGVPGYDGILEALQAPTKTPWQKEQLEWLGEGFDPECFDLKAVNRELGGRRI